MRRRCPGVTLNAGCSQGALEARRAILEEARRLRTERDGAQERERALKRGGASLKEEVSRLSAALKEAQANTRAIGENEELRVRVKIRATTGILGLV